MSPNSRVILVRHAQGEHNVGPDCSIHDAPLTELGKDQARSLAHLLTHHHEQIDLVVSSPLRRTLQTTKLGFGPAIDKTATRKVLALPQAQECDDDPCDVGSARQILENDSDLADCDFSLLTPEWTSKKGFWDPDPVSLQKRGAWVRQWLLARPEKTIALVAHGDFLPYITSDANCDSEPGWNNAEVRMYEFKPDTVTSAEPLLTQVGNAALVKGYPPNSSTLAD